jgi:nucleotide-binding universal stress UspA family protein
MPSLTVMEMSSHSRDHDRDRVLVVGVDGSPNSAVALGWAVQEACRHGGQIRVVAAWHHGLAGAPSAKPGAATPRQLALSMVQRVLDQVPHAAVDVRVAVVEGAASAALVETAADADLLIVGALGVEASRRVVLGSVSRGCALHATCPVVVVPAGWRGSDRAQHLGDVLSGSGPR